MILDQDLDRLADGELSPAERRELLQALETSPSDWRRCALAFVESQVLSEELGSAAREAAASPSAAPRKQASPASYGGWLALAASVLVAFAAGSLTGRLPSSGGGPLIADSDDDEMPTIELPTPNDVETAIATRQQRADEPDADVVTFWTKDETGGRRSLRTRLVDANKLDEQLGVQFRSALPPEVRQEYEQQGYRFESRRRYAPLNMDDGRVLVVPVEDLHVKRSADDYL